MYLAFPCSYTAYTPILGWKRARLVRAGSGLALLACTIVVDGVTLDMFILEWWQ